MWCIQLVDNNSKLNKFACCCIDVERNAIFASDNDEIVRKNGCYTMNWTSIDYRNTIDASTLDKYSSNVFTLPCLLHHEWPWRHIRKSENCFRLFCLKCVDKASFHKATFLAVVFKAIPIETSKSTDDVHYSNYLNNMRNTSQGKMSWSISSNLYTRLSQ